MTIDLTLRDVAGFVDRENGLVSRRIFQDRAIYDLEMEQIFARAWLFMCHESQIPNPGDFFLNFMGEDRVIVVRNNDGGVSVLVNSCRHRGNAVCRADEGHATSFMCTYHGWTYDLKGSLVGVPGFKEVYHEELDRENWGLISAGRVESYKGFVFATMDPEAPALADYLGDAGRWGLDLVADQGEMKVVGGVHKWHIDCNWKFPADNTADFYHPPITHAGSQLVGLTSPDGRILKLNNAPDRGISLLSDYGHIAGLSYLSREGQEKALNDPAQAWRHSPETASTFKAKAASCMTNIFPNLFIKMATKQVAIRMPKGPTESEIWDFTLVNANDGPDEQRRSRHSGASRFGAGGISEQDDVENWDQSTVGARGVISGRYPLNYQMNLHRGEIINDEAGPPRIESSYIQENYHMWQYMAWSEFMAAPSWPELQTTHTRPTGTI